MDAAAGNLHLRSSDTIAIGTGVGIAKVTTVDFDGQPRPATRPVAGADVPGQEDARQPHE